MKNPNNCTNLISVLAVFVLVIGVADASQEHYRCVYSEFYSKERKSVQEVKGLKRFPEMPRFTFMQLNHIAIFFLPFHLVFYFTSREATFFSLLWLLRSLFWDTWCLRALLHQIQKWDRPISITEDVSVPCISRKYPCEQIATYSPSIEDIWS